MDAASLLRSLEGFPAALRGAVAGVSPDEARRKPDERTWSILEIVCHLVDEELRDFPVRLESTLKDPAAPWPPIDPEGWARDERYNERDLAAELDRFAAARTESVARARAHKTSSLANAHEHPKLGRITAADMLAAWAAHDWLHLRQIAKRRFELVRVHAGDASTAYAGDWSA